jgi:hypothetical protein
MPAGGSIGKGAKFVAWPPSGDKRPMPATAQSNPWINMLVKTREPTRLPPPWILGGGFTRN